MKRMIAAVFALSLAGIPAANADILGAGVHVGPIGVGEGASLPPSPMPGPGSDRLDGLPVAPRARWRAEPCPRWGLSARAARGGGVGGAACGDIEIGDRRHVGPMLRANERNF